MPNDKGNSAPPPMLVVLLDKVLCCLVLCVQGGGERHGKHRSEKGSEVSVPLQFPARRTTEVMRGAMGAWRFAAICGRQC